jgi:HAE1 family hydrophobic/amphiphilic exporter-1
MTLPELSIRRPVSVLMLLVSLVTLGAVALWRLPLAFMPEIEEPELFVRLPYANASPEQVERLVVRPVEDVLGSVKGLRKMWSRCGEDGGSIRLEYDWSTNIHLARVEIWEKLERVRRELPEDMGDITVGTHWNNRESDSPVLEGRLSSQADLAESYELLDRRIVKPLQRVDGVAQVRLDGVSPREVRVNLRLADLEHHKMDVREVTRILRGANFDQSLGRLTAGGTRYSLRTVGSFVTVEEIAALPIRKEGLRLKDVADVVYEQPELDFGRHLDGQFAIGITVSAEARANVVKVCDALEARIRAMDDDPELQGVNFLIWFSQGREIKKTLKELFHAGVYGAALAAIVLFAFLRRLSTTVAAVLCIPFSLIVTCGFIWAQGKTLNTLSLLGLIVGIGMLVDNAVVVLENIFRHQELGLDPKRASRAGAAEVATAVSAATLTSVIVFLPMVFNRPSEMGITLKEIGVTVSITLLASLFVSQTLIPLSTSWRIRAQARPRGRLLLKVEGLYERALEVSLRRRWLMPLLAVAIAASAIYPYSKTDINFDNDKTDPYVQVHYRFSEEISIDRKERMVSRIEKHLEPYREELRAKSIYSWWSDSFTMTRVYLRDGEVNEENLALARERLRKLLPQIPGLRLDVTDNQRSWRFDRGKRVAFQINAFGEDARPEVLADLAEEARVGLSKVPGLFDAQASTRPGQQELHVEMKRDLASRLEISGDQIRDSVGLTFRGRRLPRFRTADGEREMRLTLDEKKTESRDQLENLPLWTASGKRVPLVAVAEILERPAQERIERDDRMTSISVGAQYSSGTREDYLPAVEAMLDRIEFPYGYTWSFGSWQARRQERTREFLENLLLALVLVFAVMASTFESVRQAIALMVSLPFAAAGAIWTLYLAGADFDQPASVGLLLLIGVVVNNGIVMIEHINQYRRRGVPRLEAMRRGSRERLRPILMTATTTVIGLVPIIVQRPSFGGVYYSSMALVIVGGMVLSTFLTLLFLPTTVTLVEDALAAAGRWARPWAWKRQR